jgi:cytochrome c
MTYRMIGLIAFGAVTVLAASTSMTAAENELQRGHDLLQKDCARCHAIGKTGDSPRKDAPAFRTLGRRYPVESLEEALGEGIVTGHNDMPEFRFDAADVGAIIDYLKSIQER